MRRQSSFTREKLVNIMVQNSNSRAQPLGSKAYTSHNALRAASGTPQQYSRKSLTNQNRSPPTYSGKFVSPKARKSTSKKKKANEGKKKFSVDRRSMKYSDTKSLPEHGSPELMVDAYSQ